MLYFNKLIFYKISFLLKEFIVRASQSVHFQRHCLFKQVSSIQSNQSISKTLPTQIILKSVKLIYVIPQQGMGITVRRMHSGCSATQKEKYHFHAANKKLTVQYVCLGAVTEWCGPQTTYHGDYNLTLSFPLEYYIMDSTARHLIK